MRVTTMRRGKWAQMRQYATPAIVGCLGVGLSILAFSLSRARIAREERGEFARVAQVRVTQLRQELEEHRRILRSVQAFYDGSQNVERYEFRSFVSTVLGRDTDIHALAWVPRVTDAQRADLERTAASEGFPGFEITHLNEEGLPAPARRQREYFPLLYVAPLEGNKGLLGMDWAQNPDLRAAMARARDTGDQVTVLAIRQPGLAGDPQYLSMLVPVYGKGTWVRTEESRRANIEGFLAVMFRPEDVIMAAAPQGIRSPVNLRLVSIDDVASGAVLYAGAQGGYRAAAKGEQPEVFEADGALHGVAALKMDGITWTVACEDNPEFGRFSGALIPALILGGGLLLVGVITTYLISVARSSERIRWYAHAQGQAHDTARRESAKLSSMISGMEEGVVFADASNAIVEVNDYFCKFVGKTRGEIVGTPIENFHDGEVLGHVRMLIDGFRAKLDSQPFIMQRVIGHVDVILRVQPIYRDGRYDGALLNAIDVTELAVARRRAEEATRTKSEFLANMSHEIRTPMTAILGYADLLADQTLGNSARSDYVDVIRRNGKHLLTLINDILDLSKIESGKAIVENGQCDLVGMIAEVASTMRARALERGTALTAEYPTRLPKTLMTDCARLRQILVNLVGNAVKFTEKGTVRIRTSFIPSWRKDEAGVRFEVIDTGIGISEENMSRLFQPFVQADSSTSRQYGGTGLGLAITSRIVDLLGGDISATSELGAGSTFTVTIPAGNIDGVEMLERPEEAVQAPNAAAEEVVGGTPLNGLRVLVAEDGPDNQRLIRMLLSRAGAEVTIVEDGIAAVEAAKDDCFDVVLMDLQMPRMDGYEATRALRASGYSRPILALTAHAMSADREKCLAAGCDDHLTKPINVEALLGKVSQWGKAYVVAH